MLVTAFSIPQTQSASPYLPTILFLPGLTPILSSKKPCLSSSTYYVHAKCNKFPLAPVPRAPTISKVQLMHKHISLMFSSFYKQCNLSKYHDKIKQFYVMNLSQWVGRSGSLATTIPYQLEERYASKLKILQSLKGVNMDGSKSI